MYLYKRLYFLATNQYLKYGKEEGMIYGKRYDG